MKTYKVEITETLQKAVVVQARSREEAKAIVEEQWRNSEYILDAENFVSVEFKALAESKIKDYVR
jgi:hypothetical protein